MTSIEIEFSDLKDVIYPEINSITNHTITNPDSIMDTEEFDVTDPSTDEDDRDDASEASTISRMNSNKSFNSFVRNSDSNSSFRDCAFDNDDNCFKN